MENQDNKSNFNKEDFAIVSPRTFKELVVGEVFRAPSRTLTDAHASAFQAVSADNHPIHYDMEYAQRYGHTSPVVHGLQVLAFTTGRNIVPSLHWPRVYSIYIAYLRIFKRSTFWRHSISCSRNY